MQREKSEIRESCLVAELVEIKDRLTKLRVLKGESSTTLADHERRYSVASSTGYSQLFNARQGRGLGTVTSRPLWKRIGCSKESIRGQPELCTEAPN